MTMLPLELFVSPAFVDRAVTDAPLRAFVPISILRDPVEALALERFPRAIIPEPEIVILRVGSTRAVTMIPLIVPLALDPTNVSFQLIGAESAPLPTTTPVPICEAEVREMVPTREKREMLVRRSLESFMGKKRYK
jgi:hypothetical protein